MTVESLTDLMQSIAEKQLRGWQPPPEEPAPDPALEAAKDTSFALRSVPVGYRWAKLGDPLLTRRVRAKAELGAILDIVFQGGTDRIVFLGAAGMGKTSLACALLREFVDLRLEGWRHVAFVHAYRLAKASAQHELGHGDAPLVELAGRCSLLLLDDLGNERKTELSPVADVIFDRHCEERSTWVTTAFGPDEIAKRYGDGIARRVYERATIIKLGAT